MASVDMVEESSESKDAQTASIRTPLHSRKALYMAPSRVASAPRPTATRGTWLPLPTIRHAMVKFCRLGEGSQ